MGSIQQVIFRLDDEEYGLDIMKVSGIERYHEVVKVPNGPEYIEGIINLRGEVLPIYSLRKKFHLENKEPDDETKIIVAFANDMRIGFIVDSVAEILHIGDKQIEETPKIITGINRRYIKSVAKVDDRMVVLVDIDLIISDEELNNLDDFVEEVAEEV